MTYLDPVQVVEIINKTEGQIVTVVFIKRTNGDRRQLTGRIGVGKYVKGVGLAYEPAHHQLLTIFDVQLAKTLPEGDRSKAYRMIPIDSVLEIRAGGDVVKGTT